MITDMAPIVRKFNNPQSLVLDLLPPLLDILQPTLRPVSVNLFLFLRSFKVCEVSVKLALFLRSFKFCEVSVKLASVGKESCLIILLFICVCACVWWLVLRALTHARKGAIRFTLSNWNMPYLFLFLWINMNSHLFFVLCAWKFYYRQTIYVKVTFVKYWLPSECVPLKPTCQLCQCLKITWLL